LLLREAGGAVLRDAGGADGREIRHRGLHLRVRDLRHDRQRHRLRERQQLFLLAGDIPHLLHVGEDVAIRLEDAAEVRQLRINRVAGLAGHARLAREARYRTRFGCRGEQRYREEARCDARGSAADRSA